MKKIFSYIMMFAAATMVLSSCEDDRDSNPTLQTPTTFVLNESPMANQLVDLANSEKIVLKCSQPDYGFPVSATYSVEVSFNADMSNSIVLDETYNNTVIEIDAKTLASTLTLAKVENEGMEEAQFPLDLPLYFRVTSKILSVNEEVPGTAITSNTIALNNVHLAYTLAPVEAPSDVYVIGKFCDWKWDNCLTMVHVHSTNDVLWTMVWLDDEGIKLNTAKSWDSNDVGYDKITVSGDLKDEIVSSGGNIATSVAGGKWYLMVVTTSVNGREIKYDVQFNEAKVWLMGPIVGNGNWAELEEGWSCEIPTVKDDYFVSPAFAGSVPGGDGDGVRAYVKVPGYDWWKSEFIVLKGKIAYRGTGDDQDRVKGDAGQRLYLNFFKGEGEIK
ncbi:SusF/SusE family outer membrane protein [Palleniella muris]|uniref:SusF/SusE family outer membrane protein n=1 Tax=Palleniella muris TaxID=3038145 RepID=A0AC61QPZ6_9BACT|nr:SusF/SusE family outer membrane protein [Palleniella muris]TGX82181.1 SusF/SusE family outer membrane protein [Palleniella muris]